MLILETVQNINKIINYKIVYQINYQIWDASNSCS